MANDSILLKANTDARWAVLDPILKDREIVYFKTSKTFAVGDGITRLHLLDKVGGGSSVANFADLVDAASANIAVTNASVAAILTLASAKQDPLVSGVNIKTVGGQPLPGAGDISVAVVDGGISTAKLADGAVTSAKIAPIGTKQYLGRTSGGTGPVENVPLATLKDDLGLSGAVPIPFSSAVDLSSPNGFRMSPQVIASPTTLSLAASPVTDGYCELTLIGAGSTLTIPGNWSRDGSAPDMSVNARSRLVFTYIDTGDVLYKVFPLSSVDVTAPIYGTPHLENGAKNVIVQGLNETIGTVIPATGDVTLTNAGGRTVSSVTKSGSDLLITVSSVFDWQGAPSIAIVTNKTNDLAGNLAGPRTTIAVTNNIPMPAPGAPTGIATTAIGSTSLGLVVTPPVVDATHGNVNDYVWEYSLAGSGTWFVFADGTSTTPSVTITGLSTGTSYDLRCKATNLAGASSYNTLTSISTASAASLTGAITNASDTTISAFSDYVLPGRVTGTSGINDGKDGTALIGALSMTNLTPFAANTDAVLVLTYPVGALDGGAGNGIGDQALGIGCNGTGSAHIDFTVPSLAGQSRTVYVYFRGWWQDGATVGSKIVAKITATLSDGSVAPLTLTQLNEAQFALTPAKVAKFTFQPAASGTLAIRIATGDADGITIAGGAGIALTGVVYSSTGV